MAQVNVDMDILIALVQARPVIWDKTISTYKDRNETKNAWTDIFLELSPDFKEFDGAEKNSFGKQVMKKWVNVRDAFHKSIKKQKEATRSGSGASSLKTYIYNGQLQFLNKVFKERQTENSLPATAIQGDISDEEISQESSVNEGSQVNTKVFKKAEPKKRKLDEVEIEFIKALKETPDRHLSFFKGIIPSLSSFDDDEVLEFQATVLQTIQSIKKKKKTHSSSQQIAQTQRLQVSPTQQLLTTTRSYHSKIAPALSTTPQPFSTMSAGHLPTPFQELNNQQTSAYNTSEPICSDTNELSMRRYYENVENDPALLLSPLSQNSQDSIDFSY